MAEYPVIVIIDLIADAVSIVDVIIHVAIIINAAIIQLVGEEIE